MFKCSRFAESFTGISFDTCLLSVFSIITIFSPRNMQEFPRGSTNCTLEPVPKSELPSTYIYSIPDRSSLYAVENIAQHEHLDTTRTPSRKRRWARWQFLLCYGLLIAVVAGLAGGFIGKTIENNNRRNDKAEQQAQNTSCRTQVVTQPAIATASSIASPTALSATISEPTGLAFKRTIPLPDTGCKLKNTQSSFRSFTTFLDIQYTTFCNTGWLSDELFAVSVATASDCIEACVMYNAHRPSDSQERICVGGGFIPEWWNQTKAMAESGGMAYNCFLKSNDSNIGRNDRDIEVVTLCMPGSCQGVLN